MKAHNSYSMLCITAMVAGLFAGCMSYAEHTEVSTTQNIKENVTRELKRHQMECIRSTRVNPDLVVQLKAGHWKENKPLKKWILCVLHKRDLMTMEGVYKLDVALSKIPEANNDAAQILINKCLSPKAMPPEEIAWNYAKCHLFLSNGKFSAISVFEDNIMDKHTEKVQGARRNSG